MGQDILELLKRQQMAMNMMNNVHQLKHIRKWEIKWLSDIPQRAYYSFHLLDKFSRKIRIKLYDIENTNYISDISNGLYDNIFSDVTFENNEFTTTYANCIIIGFGMSEIVTKKQEPFIYEIDLQFEKIK